MRRLAVLVLGLGALAACGPSRPALSTAAGDSAAYVQRFRLSERRSGEEELPTIVIEQRVTVTCTDVAPDGVTLDVRYGDTSVWLGGEDAEPDFVATDVGAVTRAFEEAESDLATMYAALWATTAHIDVHAEVDPHGKVRDLVGGLEEARRVRGDDPSDDLGGAFLESLIDDPTLLWPATDEEGRRPLRFRLDRWNATFRIAAERTVGDDGAYHIAYESRSGPERDGPFAGFDLVISGDGVVEPRTGLLRSATLRLDVAAAVPPEGRRDSAVLEYSLRHAIE